MLYFTFPLKLLNIRVVTFLATKKIVSNSEEIMSYYNVRRTLHSKIGVLGKITGLATINIETHPVYDTRTQLLFPFK